MQVIVHLRKIVLWWLHLVGVHRIVAKNFIHKNISNEFSASEALSDLILNKSATER